MLVARYAHYLPLYRLAQMLAGQGLAIGREVLADWIGTAAQEIAPVVRRMREILLASAPHRAWTANTAWQGRGGGRLAR